MTNGNESIQQFIEYGKHAVQTYSENNINLTWSPITYSIARIAFYDALTKIPEEHREWMGTTKEKRMEKKLEKPPLASILLFNFYHAVNSIYYALRSHYPNITRNQVEELNIDHEKFHEAIARASGLIAGQETVQKFPDSSGPQDTQGQA